MSTSHAVAVSTTVNYHHEAHLRIRIHSHIRPYHPYQGRHVVQQNITTRRLRELAFPINGCHWRSSLLGDLRISVCCGMTARMSALRTAPYTSRCPNRGSCVKGPQCQAALCYSDSALIISEPALTLYARDTSKTPRDERPA